NPGCYPTGVLLALAPALRHGLLDPSRPVIIDAASGVTGAGRAPKREMLFGEVAEDYRAYAVGNGHRHVPEMRRGLARISANGVVSFVFTPHLLPVRRGILETIYLPLSAPLPVADAAGLWAEAYAGEPFVEVLGEDLPGLQAVVGRNVVSMGFAPVADVDDPIILPGVARGNQDEAAAGHALLNSNQQLGLDE